MPGLCGAIKLHGSGEPASLEPMVSTMLRALHREPFYDLKTWNCPAGRASFASLGLGSLQEPLPSQGAGPAGLSYGRASFAGDPSAFDLARIRGSFSLAAYDSRDDSYVVAVDRRASEPIYFTLLPGALCFAPEVGALLSLRGVSRVADYGALSSLVVSGHLLRDMTLFRGIRRLQGGRALKISRGEMRENSYWTFSPGATPEADASTLTDRLHGLLEKSIEDDAGPGSMPTAIFLSGGCDSRVILGYARRRPDLTTVSWGSKQSGPGSDAEVAQRLARHCASEHLFVERETVNFAELFEEMSVITEAQSDVAAFHPYEFAIMKLLREKGIRRVVRGDETFGWKKMSRSVLSAFVKVGLRDFSSVDGLGSFFRPPARHRLAEDSRAVSAMLRSENAGMSANRLKDFLYFTQRLQNYLNSCATFKRCLLEHANPLIADDVLDFLSLVPDDLRTDKKLLRLLLQQRFPDLHGIEYARSDGLEDWSQLWRRDSPVRSYLAAQLDDAESGIWKLYDRRALRRLFESRRESCGYSSLGFARRTLTRAARDLSKPFGRTVADHCQAELVLRAPLGGTKLLMRFLVIKNWVDRTGPVLD